LLIFGLQIINLRIYAKYIHVYDSTINKYYIKIQNTEYRKPTAIEYCMNSNELDNYTQYKGR